MEKEQRSRLQKATQDARKLLEEEFRSQLLQTYDIDVEKVRWAEEPGAHLQAEQRLIREKLVAWIEHKEAQIHDRKEALLLALREMAFTALNRFVALKLMEARELVRPCVSGGLESAGFLEFTAVAQGLLADQESSYRLYLETIFEDVSRELRALFDPRDPASLIWPKRAALLELLDILNRPELAELWSEDETLGWVYQYFNGDAERKKMREESSAPRNSRELAVRNQFFTPRYVVEFLTDNTLGRIWYEMRQGNTGLKNRCRYLVRRPNEVWMQPGEEPPAQADADETLSQEELLHQPVHIAHRPLKDPREIRMLDPACGSMHFGLYAFDLYLEIYVEAWEIAQGSDGQAQYGEAFAPFVTYAAGFTDKAAFLREVPRLILQHNIHGIDIDLRATQIARLTLWLRSQRSWQKQQLEVADRPSISRSNVVCAEPMPGERELLADFVDDQFPEAERGLVQQLLEAIFDKMQLAGEAGPLLKIEDEIRDAIDQARREWQKLAVQQKDLFNAAELDALGQAGSSLDMDLQNLTKNFWIDIEERIYAALRHYSEQAESSSSFQRRLFAEDAAQGFAFIDVCRTCYDVVLMNPPFGEATAAVVQYLPNSYVTFHDLFASFVERGLGVKQASGLLGAITSRTGFFISSLGSWRRTILDGHSFKTILDLGSGVLDSALVSTAAYTIGELHSDLQATVVTLLDVPSEQHVLTLDPPLKLERLLPRIYFTNFSNFECITGTPLCYWLSSHAIGLFRSSKGLKSGGRDVRVGLQTGDNFRFLRLYWEVPSHNLGKPKRWIAYAKGGDYSPYYRDIELVIDWADNGQVVKVFAEDTYGSQTRTIKSQDFYFRPGLTFTIYTVKGFNIRPLPSDSIFDVAGSSAFVECNRREDLLYLMAFMGSRVFQYFISALSDNRKWQVGLTHIVPWVEPGSELKCTIAAKISEAYQATRSLKIYDETEHNFLRPQCLETSVADWQDKLTREANLLQEKIGKAEDEVLKDLCQLYGFEERELVRFAGGTDEADDGEQTDDVNSGALTLGDRNAKNLLNDCVQNLISYSFGAAVGRWDIRYATGEQVAPELPDPFAPLPVCPPGQLQNKQALPAQPEDVVSAYPIRIPWDGILIDDPNHPLDFELRVREVIEIIWSGQEFDPTAKAIEHEACEILGVKSLRDYFRKPSGFFADHLKRYSKSRRQAPIYWQLTAASGSYSAWLYYHRFTQDTLYRVLHDFVEPRIQQAEREQFELESQGALSGDAAIRLQEAQTLLQDLRLLKSEVDLVAPLWKPNLNDGVIINHAILWRITPYTPWQKKCKECWDKLVKGDYDWAHLAFHLWPERVIPKCVTDRSLAIAHGLEERLWHETNNGNWLPRQLAEADLQALIAEHSNPAVKSALERFLAAPPPVAPTRTRASRSTRASGSATPRRARGSAAVVDAEATRQVLLALSAAPSDGLAKAAIADLIGVEANALTAVIKQLKESGQIDQLGERRGARYVLSEQGRAAVASQAGEDD